eukprot:CAMPEP_0179110816 /NCGR_PEP_ID=MMETSP0796-20121207/51735_1 /TAXON_ID=73915 /ORGANISM="Pyrodinium bahamense, Strain pbaha01" /LENGTH=162 /DNA_ID=CAMNT_0020808959 /DNA_START=261 /DNA_END=745 /DNA_ORIENTATION=+
MPDSKRESCRVVVRDIDFRGDAHASCNPVWQREWPGNVLSLPGLLSRHGHGGPQLTPFHDEVAATGPGLDMEWQCLLEAFQHKSAYDTVSASSEGDAAQPVARDDEGQVRTLHVPRLQGHPTSYVEVGLHAEPRLRAPLRAQALARRQRGQAAARRRLLQAP